MLPQALEIIFKVQRKRSNEKITRKRKSFLTCKTFVFSNLWTPLTFKLHNFLIFLFILNDLKCYRRVTSSSTSHVGTLIATKQHTWNFLGVQEPAFLANGDLFF
jgi:hypothetical protein